MVFPVRIHPFAVLAIVAGCSGGQHAPDAGSGTDLADRALAMTRPGAVLPARPEVISVAQGIEADALREGTTAVAVAHHVQAAQLMEAIWRVEHREQDGREAVDMYRAAGKELSYRGACDAAVRGAKLTGEMAGDAAVTYGELYRVLRRSGGSADGGTADACGAAKELASLTAFRLAPSVLDAIEQGLVGEGLVGTLMLDAGSARSHVAPRVTRIEQWTGPEAARVVVHLDRTANFRTGDSASAGGKGARTWIDLDGVDLEGPGREVPLGGIVSRIVAESTTTGSRIALDLSGPAYRRVFHLLEPFRVVIDVAKKPPGSTRTVSRIVLDPGHGGNDPGATGPSGLKEKDVTLAIAHKIAPVLAKQGMEVGLTRDDDRYVTLEERTARANSFGADLFVSIHCNASENKARRGVETYVLDTSQSELAGKVAARENATSQAATNEIGQLLASMRVADQSVRSTKLADLLQRAAASSLTTKYSDTVDGGVHKASFYVLVGARMPAALFETSYISNATEEQRLGSEDYQQRLADAVANAVKAYKEGR